MGAALLLCLTLPLHAQDSAPQDPAIIAAEQAMAANLPEVAVEKLNAFLISTAALDDSLRERAEQDLTEAMLDSGDAVGALARLEFPSSDVERLWKAEALSSVGQWDDAVLLYESIAGNGPPDLHEAATIGQAEALHALDRDDEARSILAALEAHSSSTLVRLRLAELYLDNNQLDPARDLIARSKPATPIETGWRQYVEGRLYLAEDQPAPALEDFQELLDNPRGLTAALHAGATIGLTEARIALNGFEAADDVLESFISDHPDSPWLEEMFRRLDRIYAAEESPSDAAYQQWTAPGQAQAQPRRAALALYYEARLLQHQGRRDKAIGKFTEFTQQYPGNPLAFEASMQLGNIYLATNRIPQAIAAFEAAMRSSANPKQRARAELADGNASFAGRDFLVAADLFHDAAADSSDVWLNATYDSALAWLNLQNYDRFLDDYNAISRRYPEKDERRNLLLEEGLLQARSGDPRAAATLESFIRDFPDNRRVSEAQIALAELVYAGGGLDSASQLLRTAYESSPSPQSREQADYLSIFIADSPHKGRDEEVIRLGNKFLDDYPSSTLRAQVRMKLGQLYFAREDFANAQTQFETLAEESPSDALADNALILAGQSSVRGMSSDGIEHALTLFERVAKGAGPLRLYARQEQALLEAQKGDNTAAVVIYDDILRSNPETTLRLAALCGKADCLVAAGNDAAASPSPPPAPAASPAPAPDPFTTAIALYDQIAADPDATAPWRDQALFKKGRCLKKQGFNVPALEAFYDVLTAHSGAAPEQPDFYWFEKAGYEAEAMLEAKNQWPGAISILEKVASAGGPRSAEAHKQADQLRLAHFVWQ